MNPINWQRVGEIALSIVNVIVTISLVTFSVFNIFFWGKALVRVVQDRNPWSGIKEPFGSKVA